MIFKLQFQSPTGNISIGDGTKILISKSIAFRKALKYCCVCWGLAIISILIPLVHFVSVPLLLIAGPPVGFFIYKFNVGSNDIIDVNANCPECKAPLKWTRQVEIWPMRLTCVECNIELVVTEKSGEIE